MGTYTLIDHFSVVDIPDTNVILGVQWLITLGKVTTDWETLEMEWTDKKTGLLVWSLGLSGIRAREDSGDAHLSSTNSFNRLDGGRLPEGRNRVGSGAVRFRGRIYKIGRSPKCAVDFGQICYSVWGYTARIATRSGV